MSKVIRIATVNLAKGELRWEQRATLLMEQLAALRPDIIGFQEVDLRIDQGNSLYRRFNDLVGYESGGDLNYESGGDPQYRMYHMANPRDRVAVEALGILTHLPVISHEGFDYLFRNRVAHCVRVELQGSSLDFYNTHLHHEARPSRERSANGAGRKAGPLDGPSWLGNTEGSRRRFQLAARNASDSPR